MKIKTEHLLQEKIINSREAKKPAMLSAIDWFNKKKPISSLAKEYGIPEHEVIKNIKYLYYRGIENTKAKQGFYMRIVKDIEKRIDAIESKIRQLERKQE